MSARRAHLRTTSAASWPDGGEAQELSSPNFGTRAL